jgi:hypothetical protein
MKTTFAAWMWSLETLARSYATVVALAAIVALWVYLLYRWLGLPESSGLLLALAFIWGLAQLFATVAVVGGTADGAAATAAAERSCLGFRALWLGGGKKIGRALVFWLLSGVVAWAFGLLFAWVNDHSVEVASFLTFHAEKPVSYLLLESIFQFVEGLLWIALGGFLLSFFLVLLREGWRGAGKRAAKLLAGCTYRAPFVTSLLVVAICGGAAYKLAHWHPAVAAGFRDYTQMTVRLTVVALILAAGWLLWLLALARLITPVPARAAGGETAGS